MLWRALDSSNRNGLFCYYTIGVKYLLMQIEGKAISLSWASTWQCFAAKGCALEAAGLTVAWLASAQLRTGHLWCQVRLQARVGPADCPLAPAQGGWVLGSGSELVCSPGQGQPPGGMDALRAYRLDTWCLCKLTHCGPRAWTLSHRA